MVSPERFAAEQPMFVQIYQKGNHMRIRTIAAAFVVAAPLFALGSPQAAACWETGYRSGYSSYGYSSPTYRGYYGGIGIRRVGYGAAGWRRGYGYRGVGIGRVGVGRVAPL